MLTKQAKVLSDGQIRAALASVANSAMVDRDTTMILLSVRAGLRAKEIASLRWSMLTDSEGRLTDTLRLPNSASKGRRGGREVPLCAELQRAIARLYGAGKGPQEVLILNSRGQPLGANGVAQWFLRVYRGLGYEGCSSHSGRRTAITRWARNVTTAGGSLRDVQDLAGHASLAMTARYIEVNAAAKRKVVGM